MKNKEKKKMKGRDSLSKEQSQNLKNNGSFDEFYEVLLKKFRNDIGSITPEQAKVVLVSFKTIGDQMYLYDAILLSKIAPQLGMFGSPFVVSGDTFLVDYITYTKSCNVLSPATIGNVRGKRKLRVYMKPRDPEAAKTQMENLERQKKQKLQNDIENTMTRWGEITGYIEGSDDPNNETILGRVIAEANNFSNIKEVVEGTGRRAPVTYTFGNTSIDEFQIVEYFYKLLIFLNNLKTIKKNNDKIQEINDKIGNNTLENAAQLVESNFEKAAEINDLFKGKISI